MEKTAIDHVAGYIDSGRAGYTGFVLADCIGFDLAGCIGFDLAAESTALVPVREEAGNIAAVGIVAVAG